MRREIKNVAASVRARLLKKAKAERRTFNELLQYFAMERWLYRLSVSPHAERFVLKGALMLQLWGGSQARATRDIDLLGRKHATTEEVAALVRECAKIDVPDDGLAFDPQSIEVGEIRAGEKYEGLRVEFSGLLGVARVKVQVDIGFGDAVTPAPLRIEYPAMLDFPPPRLWGYTPESTIAEKFCAMVARDIDNSRMKDFHDIWFLAQTRAFVAAALAEAIRATFSRRGVAVPEATPTAFTRAFVAHPPRQAQWAAFCRRNRLHTDLSLAEAVAVIKAFLETPIEIATTHGRGTLRWPPGGPWASA